MKRQHNILKNHPHHITGRDLRDISIVLLLSAVVIMSGVGFFLPSGNATLDGNIVPSSESPHLLWNTSWGGPDTDGAESIAVDGAGNVYVAGNTKSWSSSLYDGWIGKYSATGSLLWNKTWADPHWEFATGIAVDAAGNAYVTGYTDTWGDGSWAIYLGKYDSAGTRLWNVTWNGPGLDQAKDLALDSAGNCYVCGQTSSWTAPDYQTWVGKFEATTGTIMWNQTWGGPNSDSGEGIAVDDATGKVYVTGTGNSWPPYTTGVDIWFGKFDSTSGTRLENTTWAGPNYDAGKEITVDDFGNIYIVGYTESWTNGLRDVWLGKYNSAGTVQWNRTWGGQGQDYGYSIAVDSEGTIYVGGHCLTFYGGDTDVWLAKCNAAGEFLSTTLWGSANTEVAYTMAIGCNGIAYMAGYLQGWGAGMEDALIMAFDVQAPASCEEWWAISFLGLPVWGWLVIAGEAVVIVVCLLRMRKHKPASRGARSSR